MLEMVTANQVRAMLPDRPVGAHKGTFGTALLVAGSRNYAGAAVLTASAALRIGTGVVTLACGEVIYPLLAAHLTETTYLPLPSESGTIAPEAVPLLREKFSKATALLLGPGLGQAGRVGDFLLELLKEATDLPPLVLDADALNLLAQQPKWWELLPAHCILTPHPGEMARLMDSTTAAVQAARLEVAQEMAAKWNQIVLLKGAHTIIAAPEGRKVVQPFANPALAKAGSGDVLAGLITGLRAQGLVPFEAAVAGAYLHGLAGALARERLGATAVVAGDLVANLPESIREIGKN
jgi:NAD(P)H-hydrate epimerase